MAGCGGGRPLNLADQAFDQALEGDRGRLVDGLGDPGGGGVLPCACGADRAEASTGADNAGARRRA